MKSMQLYKRVVLVITAVLLITAASLNAQNVEPHTLEVGDFKSLNINNPGDSNIFINFGLQRVWQFRQHDTGMATALELLSVGGGELSNGNKNFLINTRGRVGIGTLNPSAVLDVNGSTRVKSFLIVEDKIGLGTWRPECKLHIADGNMLVEDVAPRIYFKESADTANPDQITSTWIMGEDNSHFWISEKSTSTANRRLQIIPGGNVGIGTTDPQERLHISNGTLRIEQRAPWICFHELESGQKEENKKWFMGGDGGEFWLGEDDTRGMHRRLQVEPGGNVGIGTTNPKAKLDVYGTTRTTILEITAGADIVEPFESSAAPCRPGDVVVIDDKNPGKLMLSTESYDKKVAGVVSGANGIKHGMILGGDFSTGTSFPVAMTGRVYVKCTIENGAILPGDRLTTSSTPGHAMRATDESIAPGAVIGKAMSSLDKDKGLVLVLVDLQ
ncbi:MAG: hypothetical protein ABIE07_09260 [Candidatus Zixiibacteriota bacterium]